MTEARPRRHRHSIRLKGYDYSQAGVYFVTICSVDRGLLFGDIHSDAMRLNPYGLVARQCWDDIPVHFPTVTLDAFVVMPNHVHGIIIIQPTPPPTAAPSMMGAVATDGDGVSAVGARHASPLPLPRRPMVGVVVGSYKSAVARQINIARQTPGAPVWQRNYYEHIVRTDEALARIRDYILNNPARWWADHEKTTGP